MHKRDILMVFLDMSGRCIHHLGASYVVSYLRSKGYVADIYVNECFCTPDKLAEELLKMDAMCIGFSVYDTNFYLVREVTKRIKQKSNGESFIIAGGPTATFSSVKMLKFDSNIDVCVRYEGEETAEELIKALTLGKELDSVRGITYRGENGEIVENISRDLPHTLDMFPSPYLSGVIDVLDCQKKNDMVMLVSSRGCVFGCRYCNFAAIGRHSVRTHSVDRVIDEVKYIVGKSQESGEKVRIDFMDDIFTIHRKRVVAFCRRLQEESVKVEFGLQTRADFIDEELLEYLYESGCRRISFGLESGVPRILNAMGKVNPAYDCVQIKEKKFIEAMTRAIDLSKKKGIETTVNVIFGWESETKDEGLRSLAVVRELNANQYAHNVLTYYAGTEIFNKSINKVKNKIAPMEAEGIPVLNMTYNRFPELYDYNPYEIPHLKSDMYRYAMERRRSIIQTIMGVGFYETESPQCLVSLSSNLTYSWLLKNISLATKIAFVRNDSIKHQYLWHYPVSAYGYECLKGDLFTNLERAEVVKPTMFIKGKEMFEQKFDLPVVVEIKDIEDVHEFYKRIEAFNQAQIVEYCSTRGHDYLFMDLCRWLNVAQCPATAPKRLIVKDDNKIYTCFCGEPVGSITEDLDLDKVRRHIDVMRKAECEIRGCDTCSVRDKCPKCLFVGEIGYQAYCKFQREMNGIKNIKVIAKAKMIEYFYKA